MEPGTRSVNWQMLTMDILINDYTVRFLLLFQISLVNKVKKKTTCVNVYTLVFFALLDLLLVMAVSGIFAVNLSITKRNDAQNYENKTQVIRNLPLKCI